MSGNPQSRHDTADDDLGEDPLAVRTRANMLRIRGFRESRVVDPSSGHEAIMWVRVWRGVREAVIASSFAECIAYRVWDADFDHHEPFVVEEDIKLWFAGGPFLDVSARLFALPPAPGWA